MTAPRDTDRLIRAFLDEGRNELPDGAYDVVRARIETTRQRVVIGPWREEQMLKYAGLAIAAAAAVLIAVVGFRSLPASGGVGGPGTPTGSPTVAPTAIGTPVADPDGPLKAGTYVAHPFGAPNRGMAFTFSVPSDAWEASADPGQMLGIAQAGNSQGVGMGFLLVGSLNGDPCKWDGTADDVAVGPTVDDLVSALANETEYATSEPTDVSLGGYTGKQVVVTMPSTGFQPADPATAIGCDESTFQIWNAEGFNIYAQGPENLWTTWILDVEGQRVVVLRSDFADSAIERRQDLDSIIDSIEITAP